MAPATATDPLWINVSASGTPSYTANEARLGAAALGLYGGRAVGARQGIRPGITSICTYANPTVTVVPHVGIVDPGLSSTQGPYRYYVPTADTHTAGAATTNPRKDIVVIRIYDHDEDASGLRRAITELVAGTPAGSPVEPAVPAGAMKIATLDVPGTGAGGLGAAVITNNFPYTVAAGGILPIRNATEEAAISSPYPGLTQFRLDSGLFVVRNAAGSAWRYVGEVFVCTSGTRPSAPAEGLTIYETDTDRVLTYNGTAWVLPVNVPRGVLGKTVKSDADQTGITTEADLTGLSVTVTLEASRTIVIEGEVQLAGGTVDMRAFLRVKESTTMLGIDVATIPVSSSNAYATGHVRSRPFTSAPSSGSHTYKLTLEGNGGTARANHSTTSAGFIVVRDEGPFV